MIKADLRKIYKQKRQALSIAERMKLDDLILIQFQKLYFDNVVTLFSYWPMEQQIEPNTQLYARYLYHTIPGLQIAYPITNFANYAMQAIVVQHDTIYHINKKGITEPENGLLVDPKNIDLIFVPQLICDKRGYRVGYGKGFYDRYLQQCKKDIIKIAFSYFEPIDEITDTHQFDVSLTHCVTPHSIYEF